MSWYDGEYDHTQRAPLYLALIAVASAQVVGGWAVPELWVRGLLFGVALLMALLALSFKTLTIRDEGQYLAVRYGPLPLFFTRIPFDQISSVELVRSSLIDGWGIHYMVGRGWTFTLWGFECAELGLGGGRKVRIGTDDGPALLDFLSKKLENAAVGSGQ